MSTVLVLLAFTLYVFIYACSKVVCGKSGFASFCLWVEKRFSMEKTVKAKIVFAAKSSFFVGTSWQKNTVKIIFPTENQVRKYCSRM